MYIAYLNSTGTITTLTNAGLISSTTPAAIYNEGYIGTLTNSGTITDTGEYAIDNSGTIGSLVNTGTLSASSSGITNSGLITSLVNEGLITGSTGMDNDGTIEILPHIDMWTTNSEGRRAMLCGWLASQTDMLSEDWMIAE